MTPNNDGRNMDVHRFARVLDNMQSKLIHKQGRKSITEEVKISKLRNNICNVSKKSITRHFTDDMTFNEIVTKSEEFESPNRGANAEQTKQGYPNKPSKSTNATSTRSSYPTQQTRPDKRQPHQHRQARPGGRSTASAGTRNSVWDEIKKTLSEQERMRRICEKTCSCCGLVGHNYKHYRKRPNKEPARTAVRELQLQQPVGKHSSKEKTKQKPQVAIRKPLDPNRVFVKVNGYPAPALIDLLTIGGDLISAQFVYLYKLPVVTIEPKTLATAIKASKGTIDKTSLVGLNWGGYADTSMCCVAHLSGWDMILEQPVLQNVRATIPAGTAPVTIQPTGMDRFPLPMWRSNRATDQESDLSTAANSVLARADELAVRAAEVEDQFNPVVEFATLCTKEIPSELPPLRKIHDKINIISESSSMPTYLPSGDRF